MDLFFSDSTAVPKLEGVPFDQRQQLLDNYCFERQIMRDTGKWVSKMVDLLWTPRFFGRDGGKYYGRHRHR